MYYAGDLTPDTIPFVVVDLGVVDPEEDCIYFCGNSLGLCAKQSREMINKTLDDWSH